MNRIVGSGSRRNNKFNSDENRVPSYETILSLFPKRMEQTRYIGHRLFYLWSGKHISVLLARIALIAPRIGLSAKSSSQRHHGEGQSASHDSQAQSHEHGCTLQEKRTELTRLPIKEGTNHIHNETHDSTVL